MSIDIERAVEKLIEAKNKDKKDEKDKVKMSSELNREIVRIEETIKELERHYSFRDLEKELDKIDIDSDSIKNDIQREIQDIVK